MSGSTAALDTNVVIDLLANDKRCIDVIRQFSQIAVPAIVLGELLYGAANSSREAANRTVIEQFIQGCRVLPVDQGTSTHYASVRSALKEIGKPIPENDVWIAAIAVQYQTTLLTRDRHFQNVGGLRRIMID